MSSGYSGTPLVKKLGIKPDFQIRLIDIPKNYFQLLGPFPEGVTVHQEGGVDFDFIHLFVKTAAMLERQLPVQMHAIKKKGMIWVSWYKKSAKIPTDVTEDTIRDMALSLGLVDVKVCAVDEKWSGLKLVWRKENR